MIPYHYLHIILGLFVGIVLGFGACAMIGAYRRHCLYSRGWNAAMEFIRKERGQA